MNYKSILLCMLGVLVTSTKASRITFNDNGYSSILVAISEDAPKNEGDNIVNNIKRMFQDALPVLYNATKYKAYFKQVSILLPPSWNHIDANETSWELFNRADIRVQTAKDDTPFTHQPLGCGESGEYISFTPNYAINMYTNPFIEQYGKPGKLLVHEWAHFRYGVFDEYVKLGDPVYTHFYKDSKNVTNPNVCTGALQPEYELLNLADNTTICSKDNNTNLYDANCTYVWKSTFKPTASLMGDHKLDSVSEFCSSNQKTTHNVYAPNEHNKKCGYSNVLDVVMKHADFKNITPPMGFDLDDQHVHFEVVRTPLNYQKFVLVVDISGSMKINDRIGKLQEAATNWIRHDLPSGNHLGIVSFSYEANIESHMTEITDDVSRNLLISRLPTQLLTATCIGCGLQKATQMLQNEGQGGVIVLITDGLETPTFLNMSAVQPDIINAGIRVVSIAFEKKADKKIDKLAQVTDGKSYFVHDHDTSNAIGDAFLGALTFQHGDQTGNLRVKLFERQISSITKPGEVISEYFDVDHSVGLDLKVEVNDLEDASSVNSIDLIGPQGSINTTIVQASRTVFVRVENATEGKWTLSVNFTQVQNSSITVAVTSKFRPNVRLPIITDCRVKNDSKQTVVVLAEVTSGPNPVLGANIKAYVEKPDSTVEVIDLRDDGVLSDGKANDGVYSHYFTKVTQPGRYSLKCQVIGNDTWYTTLKFIGSRANAKKFDIENSSEKKVALEPFGRMTSGGSFQIEEPSSFEDAYPPARVIDLSAEVVNWSNNTANVKLRWTAPGDDLDTGTVSYYRIRYSLNLEELLGKRFYSSKGNLEVSSNNVVQGSLKPLQAGSIQEVEVALPSIEPGQFYFIGLRATDKAKKVSDVSNLASFYTPRTTGFKPTSSNLANNDKKYAPKEVKKYNRTPKVQGKPPAMAQERKEIETELLPPVYQQQSTTFSAFSIVGGILFCLGIVGIIVLFTFFYTRRKTTYGNINPLK